MNDDPISQLPEPYRAAWEILHEPFDYHQMLKNVLVSAQKMVGATWGMMVLDKDPGGLEYTFPGFHALPEIYNTTIPIGRISSLAYVVVRKVIQDNQSLMIPDSDNIIALDEKQLLDKFLPLSIREAIIKRAEENWFASNLMEIPDRMPYSAMALPIVDNNKTIGGMYLHRPLSEDTFTEELHQKAQTFLTCVAIGIRNAMDVSDIKHSGFQILAIGSAELRTPATVIHGYAKMLKEQPLKIQEDLGLEKFSTILQDNAQRILLVVSDLLDYARIEQGYVYKQGVNLKDVFNPILKKYQPLVNDKRQTLILDLPDSLDIEIEADHYISQLIEMCVRGAHLNTPDGGEIKISIVLVQDSFQFRVTDSGTSLTENEQSRFFEKYYYTKWEEAVRGSGLSLYLAKRIIELWSGQIGIESLSDQGNTLWFTLAIKK
jgi:signal transduction histidine kinase